MIKYMVVLIICLLSTQVMAGDRYKSNNRYNNQYDQGKYNYGKQWVIIKETSCLIQKDTGKAKYSTRYYVYEDNQARIILERFSRRNRGIHPGTIFVENIEEKGYFISRYGASTRLNRLKQEDPYYQRRLH